MIKVKYLILGLILGISITSRAQSDWKKYDYSAYNFKIEFPQKPEFSIDSSTIDDPASDTYSWELNIEDTLHPNSYYSISLTPYAPDYMHSDSSISVVDGFINSTQNSLFEDESFTILSSSLVEKNGYPGKVFKWKNNSSEIFFEFHVFLIENNLFTLSVVSNEGEHHNILINKFFNSFEIINIPDGKFKLPEASNSRTISIQFPAKATEQTKTMDSEYGQLQVDIQLLETNSKDKNKVYVAMETTYPENVVKPNDTYELNVFYKNAIDRSLNSVDGELISIQDIYYKQYLGKEFRCYFANGEALMVYRIFYIDHSVYTFGVATIPKNDKNKEMKSFFESFKVKK